MQRDLQTVQSDLDQADRDARDIVAGLSPAQMNWQPDGGTAWSIAQNLEHLAICNRQYVIAMRSTLGRAQRSSGTTGGSIKPGWLEGYFIRSLEPPPRRKSKTFKKALPSTGVDGAQALAEFLRSHEEIRTFLTEAQNVDLNRTRFRNPFIPVMFRLGSGLLAIGSHDRRHLWQARQVRLRALEVAEP